MQRSSTCKIITFYIASCLKISGLTIINFSSSLPFIILESIMSSECDYDMVDVDYIVSAVPANETKEEPPKAFDVNQDTVEASIVENTENPYYVGLHDIDLEHHDINDRIEEADVVEQIENPYYTNFDAMNFEEKVIK